jgi:hypothetical protein
MSLMWTLAQGIRVSRPGAAGPDHRRRRFMLEDHVGAGQAASLENAAGLEKAAEQKPKAKRT